MPPGPTINDLLSTVKEKHPTADLDLVRLAYDFAAQAHAGQKRASGDDFIHHPVQVAQTLAEWDADLDTVIAGLLHDVPEDTAVTIAQVEKEFGPDIANLVAGITKLGTLKYRGIERYAENLRKMFVAIARDQRVVFIKFADRLHNLKTLDALPESKRQRVALESLEIFSPIADRLGMWHVKAQLDDLAFPYVYPEEHRWVTELVQDRLSALTEHLNAAQARLREVLNQAGITVLDVHGRQKHLYSLYRKLLRKDRDINRVFDLVATRVIVPTVADCYAALGHLHQEWNPLPGRIKDYIALPKPNGYQSLHTTVVTPTKAILEFQIRTPEMHRLAEYGDASHWLYKENGQAKPGETPPWIQDLLHLNQEVADHQQYLEAVRLNLFQHRIFVFTPRGDVIDLPQDATVVDFAYHLHSDIGNTMTGARVNGQLVSLETALKSGDVCEIITEKNRKHPNPDWLQFVKTARAKEKIRAATRDLPHRKGS